jgi:hypothetical protein
VKVDDEHKTHGNMKGRKEKKTTHNLCCTSYIGG